MTRLPISLTRMARQYGIAAVIGILYGCGGDSTTEQAVAPTPAPTPVAPVPSPVTPTPTLVVKGSASKTQTAAAPSFGSRMLAWVLPRSAHAQTSPAGSPTSMRMKFHALLISPNADCSGPYTEVQRYATVREFDLATNPTLFEGSPPAGTYRCIIFETDDSLGVIPDAAAQAAFPGKCAVGTLYTNDLYRAPDRDFKTQTGALIVARGSRTSPVVDRIYLFASRDPAAANARTGGPSDNQTLMLKTDLIVPGATTLYFDATGGIVGGTDSGAPYCVVERVEIGVR